MAFITYLSLRHYVKVVAVEGEGHVSQHRAPIFDYGHRLILDAAVRRAVHANLRKDKHKRVSYLGEYEGEGGGRSTSSPFTCLERRECHRREVQTKNTQKSPPLGLLYGNANLNLEILGVPDGSALPLVRVN